MSLPAMWGCRVGSQVRAPGTRHPHAASWYAADVALAQPLICIEFSVQLALGTEELDGHRAVLDGHRAVIARQHAAI